MDTSNPNNPLSRTFDREGKAVAYSRVSQAIADILEGTHDLSNMDSEAKATFLYSLNKLQKTMIDVGEVEHTNDWDWALWVERNDGTIEGDYIGRDPNAEDPDYYCDSFDPDFSDRDFNKMLDEDFYSELEIGLELWGGKGEAVTAEYIHLKDIKSITITQR